MVCPTDPSPIPEPTLEDRLHALAAGELDPAESKALETRIAAEPALAARYAELRRLEEALRAEQPGDMPPELRARIVAGLPPRGRVLGFPAPLRVAAAVLVAFTAWFAATGAVPTAALADPAPAVRDALGPARDLLPIHVLPTIEAPEVVTGQPILAALVGLVLLVAGLAIARRVLAPASPPERQRS